VSTLKREREMRGRFLFPKKNGCSGYLLFWPSPAGGVIQDGVERAFLGPVMVPAQLKGDNQPRWARHPGQAFLLGSNLAAGRGRWERLYIALGDIYHNRRLKRTVFHC